MGGFGECLPNHNNYVEVNKNKLDAWGIPTLTIHCAWGENEQTMSKDIAVQAAEMLAAAGAKNISVRQEISSPGLGIHEMGTARDPTSVLNEHNQAHDEKSFPSRRGLHGFELVRQSFVDLHGLDGSRLRFRGFSDEKERIVIRGLRNVSSDSLAEDV
jgi:hypothetical protein